ncbi:MAG: leucine-rich repeat domain-containing protein, partial [Christensenellaceae bacterium]|nr:leucine-rich repeat domain-containing protein [Christensenellaceae bacterium]
YIDTITGVLQIYFSAEWTAADTAILLGMDDTATPLQSEAAFEKFVRLSVPGNILDLLDASTPLSYSVSDNGTPTDLTDDYFAITGIDLGRLNNKRVTGSVGNLTRDGAPGIISAVVGGGITAIFSQVSSTFNTDFGAGLVGIVNSPDFTNALNTYIGKLPVFTPDCLRVQVDETYSKFPIRINTVEKIAAGENIIIFDFDLEGDIAGQISAMRRLPVQQITANAFNTNILTESGRNNYQTYITASSEISIEGYALPVARGVNLKILDFSLAKNLKSIGASAFAVSPDWIGDPGSGTLGALEGLFNIPTVGDIIRNALNMDNSTLTLLKQAQIEYIPNYDIIDLSGTGYQAGAFTAQAFETDIYDFSTAPSQPSGMLQQAAWLLQLAQWANDGSNWQKKAPILNESDDSIVENTAPTFETIPNGFAPFVTYGTETVFHAPSTSYIIEFGNPDSVTEEHLIGRTLYNIKRNGRWYVDNHYTLPAVHYPATMEVETGWLYSPLEIPLYWKDSDGEAVKENKIVAENAEYFAEYDPTATPFRTEDLGADEIIIKGFNADYIANITKNINKLVIPETINGRKVTIIDTLAFSAYEADTVDSLEVNFLLTTGVGSKKFNIREIDFSYATNLREIRGGAFAGAEILSLNLSEMPALTTVGERAFFANAVLTSVSFYKTKTLNTIGANAFQHAVALITVDLRTTGGYTIVDPLAPENEREYELVDGIHSLSSSSHISRNAFVIAENSIALSYVYLDSWGVYHDLAEVSNVLSDIKSVLCYEVPLEYSLRNDPYRSPAIPNTPMVIRKELKLFNASILMEKDPVTGAWSRDLNYTLPVLTAAEITDGRPIREYKWAFYGDPNKEKVRILPELVGADILNGIPGELKMVSTVLSDTIITIWADIPQFVIGDTGEITGLNLAWIDYQLMTDASFVLKIPGYYTLENSFEQHPIISIAENAFKRDERYTEIFINGIDFTESVHLKTIGANAFAGWTNLGTVSLTTIKAFDTEDFGENIFGYDASPLDRLILTPEQYDLFKGDENHPMHPYVLKFAYQTTVEFYYINDNGDPILYSEVPKIGGMPLSYTLLGSVWQDDPDYRLPLPAGKTYNANYVYNEWVSGEGQFKTIDWNTPVTKNFTVYSREDGGKIKIVCDFKTRYSIVTAQESYTVAYSGTSITPPEATLRDTTGHDVDPASIGAHIVYLWSGDSLIYGSRTAPTFVGRYSVTISIEGSGGAITRSAYRTVLVEIVKAEGVAGVITYPATYALSENAPEPSATPSPTNGAGVIKFVVNSLEQDAVPTNVGTYKIRVKYPATAYYNACSIERDFTITATRGEASINFLNVAYTGEVLSPYIGIALSEVDPGIYTETNPSYTVFFYPSVVKEPGEYTATVVFDSNADYLGFYLTATFKVIHPYASYNIEVVRVSDSAIEVGVENAGEEVFEYAINDGTKLSDWQSSGVFTGLLSDTAYTFSARLVGEETSIIPSVRIQKTAVSPEAPSGNAPGDTLTPADDDKGLPVIAVIIPSIVAGLAIAGIVLLLVLKGKGKKEVPQV